MSTHHDQSMEFVGKPKTFKSYVIGFFFSLALTVMAFMVVGKHLLHVTSLYVLITILAIVQLIVQTTCFLGLNKSEEGKWSLLPFLFTILIICILVSGSLWIMYNLNVNMMD